MGAAPPRESPWYTQTWFVVLLLWLFFPAGLIVMWTQTTWNTAVKWLVTLLPAAFVALLMIGLVYSFAGDAETTISEPTYVIPVETIP